MSTLQASENLKQIVKEKYGEIAATGAVGCGCGCGCGTVNDLGMSENYSQLPGYVSSADYALGCGIPTEFAEVKTGDVVIDLGSGAGNDAFVVRSIVGPAGKVIGIDFTEKMIERARENAEKLGFNNVEFRYGDIENIPISQGFADVVVSNCVMNLVPDKVKAFAETFRILKPGGHFSISDIVLKGQLPEGLRESAEMYAGCVAGAVQLEEYLAIIREAGFVNVTVQKERGITIPEELVKPHLSEAELIRYQGGEVGVYSITVFGEKPVEKSCCDSTCCK